MEDIYYTIDKICNKELQNRKIVVLKWSDRFVSYLVF